LLAVMVIRFLLIVSLLNDTISVSEISIWWNGNMIVNGE
jgi:hypothetical protein